MSVFRFDQLLGDDYYAFRRGEENALDDRLASLPIGKSLFADIAYVPWVIRARDLLGVELPGTLKSWLDRLELRPSVVAEMAIVKQLS